MTDPRTRSRVARVVMIVFGAALITAIAFFGSRALHDAPAPTQAAVLPTSTTPVVPPSEPPTTTPVQVTNPTSPVAPGIFPSTECAPAAVASDQDILGLGIPRPARLAAPGPEKTAFDAAVACLRAVGGKTPVLRTQLPIDAMRRSAPGDDERAEVLAFAQLLLAQGADGVVSIRSHDFTACKSGTATQARAVAELAPTAPLATCEYPSVPVYGQLFTEIKNALQAAAPSANISFTAWNEPDHVLFTLRGALGQLGAAKRAGKYWVEAAGIAGAERVFAGEFSDQNLPTLLKLRRAFVEGTGGIDPAVWALHPYRDLTTGDPSQHVVAGFERAVAPAPVWLTEVTARLSGRRGIGGRPQLQSARGAELRSQLERGPVRAILYLLTPPSAPLARSDDGWDSALADRQGRARPFVCGLAGLPVTDCPGDPSTYGG